MAIGAVLCTGAEDWGDMMPGVLSGVYPRQWNHHQQLNSVRADKVQVRSGARCPGRNGREMLSRNALNVGQSLWGCLCAAMRMIDGPTGSAVSLTQYALATTTEQQDDVDDG